jgi:hypothetical protein
LEVHIMTNQAKREGRVAYAVGAVISGLLLLGANATDSWAQLTHGVVTDGFEVSSWAVNLALWTWFLGLTTLLFSHPLWFRRMAEFGFGLVTVIGAGVLYEVFPFDFGAIGRPGLAVLARALLLAGVVVGAVEMVFAMVRMARGDGTLSGSAGTT